MILAFRILWPGSDIVKKLPTPIANQISGIPKIPLNTLEIVLKINIVARDCITGIYATKIFNYFKNVNVHHYFHIMFKIIIFNVFN